MELVVRKEKKKNLNRFFTSFGNSIDGFKYAYKYEQSMTLHFVSCVTIIVLGMIYQIEVLEWAVCILLLGMIAGAELINTSIEAVVDLETQKIHPLAKIAKDTASAAVFIFSTVALICFLIIFIPKMILIG